MVMTYRVAAVYSYGLHLELALISPGPAPRKENVLYIVMACIVVAYVVMASVVMAYIVMARDKKTSAHHACEAIVAPPCSPVVPHGPIPV